MHHYCLLLDRLEMDDVRWHTYEDHREIRPFQLIVTYSGWLMCGNERVYRHLPERVKRQFAFVHDIPRHPSDVAEMPHELLATLLLDLVVWYYPDWRLRVGRQWQHEPGYMAWYAKVSHPWIIPPDEGSTPRPANVNRL